MSDTDKIGKVSYRLKELATCHHNSEKLHPARFHYQEVLDILEEMKGEFPVLFGGLNRRGIDPKTLKIIDDYIDAVKGWADRWIGKHGYRLIFWGEEA